MAQSQRIRSLSMRGAKPVSGLHSGAYPHCGRPAAGDGERAATEVLEHLHNSEDGYRRMMLEDALT